MNIDNRLRAASQALKESSVAQVDAACRLPELVRRAGQLVAHGRTDILLDESRESLRPLAPSLPPSGKVSAVAAGSSVAATPTSRWVDGEAVSTVQSQPLSGKVVGRLLRPTWRYRWLVGRSGAAGAVVGSGWAARQPTLYEGVARVVLAAPGTTSPPGETSQPPVEPARYLDNQAQLMRSAPVLERAVELTRNRISVETLRQRLEVDVAKDADLLTIGCWTRPRRGRHSWPTRCQSPMSRSLPADLAR